MTPNNNLSVLPWYTDIKYQNHRKTYAFGNIYPLYTPVRTLLPFQIMRETREENIVSVKLYNKKGELYMDITNQIIQSGLQIKRFETYGYDIIINPGILPMSIVMPEGVYYASISDGIDTFYSELFTCVNNMSKYMKIEWFDIEDLQFDNGAIVYKNPFFKNVVYLPTELGKPEYPFKEDGEDRDGYFFPEKQISEKTYKFVFLAPEYLCDAMRIIRMSDYVNVYFDGRTYNCDTFLITPKWQTQGDIASVETEFECGTVIKKIGRGIIKHDNGDYNIDFNLDYNNGVDTTVMNNEFNDDFNNDYTN